MESNRYDVIVIGAGIAGLSAAAHLAKAGQKVIVLEQHNRPGGLWTSFVRNGVVFDIGAHWTTEADRINQILDTLDGKPVPFVPVPNLGRYIGPVPGSDIVLAKYRETFERSIHNSYPQANRESIHKLTEMALQIERQLSQLDNDRRDERHESFGRSARQMLFPNQLQQLSRQPAQRLLAQLFPGKDMQALRAALHMIAPTPNAPAIDLLMTIAMALTGRAYTPIGGAQRMGAAFADALEINHGEVEYGAHVVAIEADGREVSGVVLEDGRRYQADVVLSAADVRQTFGKLLNPKLVPRLQRLRIDRAKTSGSYLLVSLVTDLDPGEMGFDYTDVYVVNSEDIREILRPDQAELGSFQMTFPRFRTDDDNRLHGVQLITPASIEFENYWHTGPQMDRGERYQELKTERAMRVVEHAEVYLPGLRDHIIEMDVATPVTIHHYTLNDQGAGSGWAVPGSLQQKVPFLHGLYLAGHWVRPPGAYHAAVSGKSAAELILKQR